MSPLALLVLVLVQEKPYRLPSTDLKERVIWGTVCEDGPGLSFGGQDQAAPDGTPHTRLKIDGQWKAIHEELRAKNPEQKRCDELRARRETLKADLARLRAAFFEGTGEAARVRSLRLELETLERAADALDAEPAPRAYTAIAWDAKTRLFVLFGGDHLDYLSNDTWVFDPAGPKWTLRRPPHAPPPRARPTLTAAGDGKIVLKGGYTYTSATGYVSGQYRDLNDGEWTYDVAADTWSGSGIAPDARVYRTGRLHPDHYLEGPPPDRKFADTLKEVPANTWVATQPPQLPALNRDWGSAVYDPDRDLILRWSGGHSAHGGSDVLHYHTNTNRWELTMPVEFPLGQLYTNTEYPEGVNFNRRPWVTGHTYQSYGYDARFQKMFFVGRKADCHVWDPSLGDWTGRFPKPKEMTYGDAYYTLTLTSTPAGLVCWTKDGRLFGLDGTQWIERPLKGKLAGSVVDNSTLAYDAKRDRLLFWRKGYGDKTPYDGEIQAVDKDGVVTSLSPEGRAAAVAVPYLCQIRYDVANDLFLVGGTLPGGRTPAYDPAGNRWASLQIGGDDPSGKKGRNVSLGLMYDTKRKLFWAVDTNSQVFVLRVDLSSADLKPL